MQSLIIDPFHILWFFNVLFFVLKNKCLSWCLINLSAANAFAQNIRISKTTPWVVSAYTYWCCSVLSQIRVDLNQTVSRQLTICLRFPDAYPQYNVLIELKSKTLSAKLLDGLTNLCDQRAKQLLGHPQVLEVLKFLSNYLIENPLCVVYDEIAGLRKLLADGGGELKLKQRQQSALLTAKGGQYYFKIKVAVPENYPVAAVS